MTLDEAINDLKGWLEDFEILRKLVHDNVSADTPDNLGEFANLTLLQLMEDPANPGSLSPALEADLDHAWFTEVGMHIPDSAFDVSNRLFLDFFATLVNATAAALVTHICQAYADGLQPAHKPRFPVMPDVNFQQLAVSSVLRTQSEFDGLIAVFGTRGLSPYHFPWGHPIYDPNKNMITIINAMVKA